MPIGLGVRRLGLIYFRVSGRTHLYCLEPAIRRRPSRRAIPRRAVDEPRVNEQIRIPRILLIDETGEKLGQFVTRDALELAKERGLDLIEVAPNARPPVCRIGDWGRIKFERQKNETEARRKQRETRTQVKEIKVRPKTDGHDLDFKTKKVRQFLTDGDKVKITVRFRGREHAHHDLGAEQCYAVYEEVKDLCKVEAPPRMDGRQMFMLLAPN